MDTKNPRLQRWSENYRVRVTAETYRQAQELATQRQTTISQLTRLALARFLDEEKAR